MEGELVSSYASSCSRRQFMQAAAAIVLQSTLAATVRAPESDPGIGMAKNLDVASRYAISQA